MKATMEVSHESVRSSLGFDEFTRRLESALGRFDTEAFARLKDSPKAAAAYLEEAGGDERLLLFEVMDHGAILALEGERRKVKQYVVGNPLIAAQMTRHDVRAGLYAPLRLIVYEGTDGGTILEFDLPSTLFGQFKRAEVDEVARALDQKLYAVIAKVG